MRPKIALIIVMLATWLSIGFVNSPATAVLEYQPPCLTGQNAFQAIYLYKNSTGDDSTPERLASLRTSIKQANGQLYTETNGARHLKFTTNASTCGINVSKAGVATSVLDDPAELVAALKSQGYNRTDRKYLVFGSPAINSGKAPGDITSAAYAWQVPLNTSWKTNNNPNNVGDSWVFIGGAGGSYGASTVLHEIFHVLGAVLSDAPHSDSGHCTDEHDLMCYGENTTNVCTYGNYGGQIDCGKNDYFNLNPQPGNFLYDHWNTADSSFLYGGGPAATNTQPVTPLTNAVVRWKCVLGIGADSGSPANALGYRFHLVKNGVTLKSVTTTQPNVLFAPSVMTGPGNYIVLMVADGTFNKEQKQIPIEITQDMWDSRFQGCG